MTTDLRRYVLTVILALAGGFAGAALWSASGMADKRTEAFLLGTPDLLPRMAEAYERDQGAARLAEAGGAVTTPFPGAVLGNPQGTVTLVEFTDYACGYCRQSQAIVEQLIARNPDLKVVIREWPIFEGSDQAARMALAAAKQGKYGAFHNGLYAAGRPTEASIARVAAAAGIDMAAARQFAGSQEASFELARNADLAQKLGFSGTPSWVIDGRTIEGAVPEAALQQAIEEARK